MTETRLSVLSVASLDRTDTGTRVRRELCWGCSPRRISIVRKLSVIAASATSLTVTSNRSHTRATSSRDTSTVA